MVLELYMMQLPLLIPPKKKNDIDAKLHGILIDKEQIWKPARTDDVVKIQSKLHLINLKKKKTRQP